MGRRRQGERVLGPYREGAFWRVVTVDAKGKREALFYASEQEAQGDADYLRGALADKAARTVSDTIDEYEVSMREAGCKERSITRATERARAFFSGVDILADLTRERCAARYDDLVRTSSKHTGRLLSVDSHRNALGASRTFLGWCVRQKYLPANPLAHVEGVGRRHRGKAQLRVDEARKWNDTAMALAPREPGAVAALLALYLGMRCGEIVGLQVRDVDAGGTLLWISESKTEAGKRTLEVPEPLRPFLLELAKGRGGGELLFGAHWRDWPRHWVHEVCDRAGVPRVSAHGMRGLHASLAAAAGVTGHVIASALGHTSEKVTYAHYAKPDAVASGHRKTVESFLVDQKQFGPGATTPSPNRSDNLPN